MAAGACSFLQMCDLHLRLTWHSIISCQSQSHRRVTHHGTQASLVAAQLSAVPPDCYQPLGVNVLETDPSHPTTGRGYGIFVPADLDQVWFLQSAANRQREDAADRFMTLRQLLRMVGG